MLIRQYVAQQPVDDFGQQISNLKYAASLAASTDTDFFVPGDQSVYKMVVRVENDTWMALGFPASAPTGIAFDFWQSELIPAKGTICRQVNAGDVLHFFSETADTCVSLVFYALPNSN